MNYNDPQVGLYAINSPPPNLLSEWHPDKPTSYSIFLATLNTESIKFTFMYCSFPMQTINWDNSIKDSLKLKTIEIFKLSNAGLNNNLKVGDEYENIFKYFKEPPEDGKIIKSFYEYNGVIFKLDLDSLHSETYKKIISIEINNHKGEL